jgi:prepilin-type N-terminal cleavage/methylation domain-containing protein
LIDWEAGFAGKQATRILLLFARIRDSGGDIRRYDSVRNANGFTLIEALIVISLMACISALAVPNLMNWLNKAKLNGAANNLKGSLELAKLKAIQENGPVAVNFTANSYAIFRDTGVTIGVHDAGEEFFGRRSLPGGVRIDLSSTTFADTGKGGKRTRFKGRGTSASGTVYLVNSKGMVKKIIVSSTGRIRTE